jgi:quinolinate synthase
VVFIPDQYLGSYVASQTEVEIIRWNGACEVHERFTGAELRAYRDTDRELQIIAHPECPPDVLAEADFVGSTSGMIRWVGEHHPSRVVMVTECSMSDNVAVEFPEIEFVRPCNLCPHMGMITLEKIRWALTTMQYEVVVPDEVAARARLAVERMLAVGGR